MQHLDSNKGQKNITERTARARRKKGQGRHTHTNLFKRRGNGDFPVYYGLYYSSTSGPSHYLHAYIFPKKSIIRFLQPNYSPV